MKRFTPYGKERIVTFNRCCHHSEAIYPNPIGDRSEYQPLDPHHRLRHRGMLSRQRVPLSCRKTPTLQHLMKKTTIPTQCVFSQIVNFLVTSGSCLIGLPCLSQLLLRLHVIHRWVINDPGCRPDTIVVVIADVEEKCFKSLTTKTIRIL